MNDRPVTVRFYNLSDVDRTLRALYRGYRPERILFIVCACGEVADLRRADASAIGWQILPNPICPECLDPNPTPYMGPARDRYMALVQQLTKES